MRDWNLGAGDPLALTLAADARLGAPDYLNDHIWEAELGGEPPALALRTTYGLRARSMRLFPRFSEGSRFLLDPASFAVPPRLRRFYPNFLVFNFSPFPGIEVTAEYWVPVSQAAAGRLALTNHTPEPRHIDLEWCGLLIPLEGQSLAPLQIQSVNVLAGQTSGLAPVLFLTGGALPGPGPYPSLMLDVDLAPGATRLFAWAQAAMNDLQSSFDLARRTAARSWDAERARIELLNASQTVEVHTGDADWDAAFALSQKAAFGLFFGGNEHLPQPSFVLARQPDHGCSRRGDGSDHPPLWSGQSPLEARTLAGLLPGAPGLAEGLLRNFLAAQDEGGEVDHRPGLAGQRARMLAAPLLADLAWQVYEQTGNREFLTDVFPSLLAFHHAWFTPAHDRDGDGIPEWDHPAQTGYEDNPAFTLWHSGSHGVDIATVESPALMALLYRQCRILVQMAGEVNTAAKVGNLSRQAEALRAAADDCWHSDSASYRYRDRDSHSSRTGRLIAKRRDAALINLWQTLERPIRLLISIQSHDGAARRPELTISGRGAEGGQIEHLVWRDFQWHAGRTAITSRRVYTNLGKIEIEGLDPKDLVTVRTVDHTFEDQTLLLPLWAGIPGRRRAQALIRRTLLEAGRFGSPFGMPVSPPAVRRGEPPALEAAGTSAELPAAESIQPSVHMPWNILIGEGLLAYGFRAEAVQLIARLMPAVVTSLKRQRAFYGAYHAQSGAGLGERNALSGLAPLGLFLRALGVQFLSGNRVGLSGQNPFPWPVTVKYRGLTVTRRSDRTEIVFQDGRALSLTDPTDAVVFPD